MRIIHKTHLLQQPQILLQVADYFTEQELTLTSVLNVPTYRDVLIAPSAEI
jgi:hypothetical protein